jgi:multimeric flavodoxin WrbA
MNEIYPMWVAAHGIMVICPVHWYQAPAALRSMMDRLVCADGGNPNPSSTQGKDAERAKQLEESWDYPRASRTACFPSLFMATAPRLRTCGAC